MSISALVGADSLGGAAEALEAGVGTALVGAGVGTRIGKDGVSPAFEPCGPRRRRIRSSPSRRSISVRSCRPMRRTRYLIVLTSKGMGEGLGLPVGSPSVTAYSIFDRRFFDSRCGHFELNMLVRANRRQLTRNAGQALAAGLGDQEVVFDSHAAPTGQIQARLDGRHHSGCEHHVVVLPDARPFGDFQAETMPQAVGSKLA